MIAAGAPERAHAATAFHHWDHSLARSAPFFFAPVPPGASAQIARIARSVSYGWGVIPVEATIGSVTFRTALFPRDGGYLLPLKDAVRKKMAVAEDQSLHVEMTVGPGPT
jgi:hypothetical protein